MTHKIRAVALVGFYRGDLVQPGTVLELAPAEFAELRSYNQVDYAPPEPEPALAPAAPAAKGKTAGK